MKRVVVLQRELPGYRIPFFRNLSARLERIDIRLIVGSLPPHARHSVVASEGWHRPIKTTQFLSLGHPLVWQHRSSDHDPCDLLVLEHAASILSNAAWLWGQHRRGCLVAFWGHGKKFQGVEPALVAAWKRHLARQADWWFGYTELSRFALEDMGVHHDRITIVRNTIDTAELRLAAESLPPDSASRLRSDLRLPPGPLFCFVGRMYREKRIGFLLDAFERVLREEPHASLLFVGDGRDRRLVEERARAGMPVRALGPQFDKGLASVLCASEAMLMPGLVGLAVVDAFCAGLPVFTTDVPFHSPEISYIRNGHNGFVTLHRPEAFASAIIGFLRDPVARRRMREACFETSRDLTLEGMVERFATGLEACLALQRVRAPRSIGPTGIERGVHTSSGGVPAMGRVTLPTEGIKDAQVRVAVVTNELPPYRRPVLRGLAERNALRVRAFLTTEREPHRHWGVAQSEGQLEVEILRSTTIPLRQWNWVARVHQERRILLTLGLGRALRRLAPHVVVTGGFGAPSLVAWLYCAFRRTPLVIWSEETPRCARSASVFQKALRSFLLGRADGVLALGREAVSYIRQCGYPESRITFCPQAVDNRHWSQAIEDARRHCPETTATGRPRVVLFVGQLLERKGILPLLNVWSAMTVEQRGGCELWIAGTGPLASEVQRKISAERIGSVQVLGALSPADLPAVFARASLLVMPSLVEIWGMVVNEAMAGGIPALVSKHCGAAELVLDGVNGELFDPEDAVAFRGRLIEWIDRSAAVDREAIRLHLAGWSIEACEQAVFSAINQVLGTESRALPS